jgi:hypothetical protein
VDESKLLELEKAFSDSSLDSEPTGASAKAKPVFV